MKLTKTSDNKNTYGFAVTTNIKAGMMRGTVKWFNETRGFGFISPADGSRDVFVHFSTIQKDGFKTLNEGQSVEFESADGPKGPQTTKVFPLS